MFKQALCSVITGLVAHTAFAAPADVPETGQTQCYDAVGTAIACTNTGQDGDLRAGLAWPSPRFVTGTGMESGCVIDRLTGLMWMQAPETVERSWASALSHADGLSLCGHDNWRLPNINELRSLAHVGKPDAVHASIATWLNDPAQGLQGVQAYYYWSSSSVTGSPASAWAVSMDRGFVEAIVKTSTFFVWPVRGGYQ